MTLTNVSTADGGSYTVDVTNSAGKITSAPAVIDIDSAPVIVGFEEWQGEHLAGTSADERAPQADPDGDGLRNLMEYFYGTRPTTFHLRRSPVCTMERRGSEEIAVLAFPGGAARADLTVVFEASPDLAGDHWTTLVHGSDGVEIEPSASVYRVGVPSGLGYRFFRMKLVLQPGGVGN